MGTVARWYRALGPLLAATLVIGLAVMPGSETVAVAVPAVAVEFDGSGELPGVESSAAEQVLPVVPEGDFSVDARSELAVQLPERAFTRPVKLDLEKLDLSTREVHDRDQYSTTYEGPDGTSMLVVGEVPQNIEVDGEWVAIDESLRRTDGGWQAGLHPLRPQVASQSGGEVLSMTDGEYELSWRLLGAANV